VAGVVREDVSATARIMNELRVVPGEATWGVMEDRDAAEAIDAAWPQARRMLGKFDAFSSAVAADAAGRGMTTIVFGAAGYPHGTAPHAAAEAAGRQAMFFYVDPDPAVTGQRGLAIGCDRRVRACGGSVRHAGAVAAVVRACRGGDGPWQVHWELGGGVADNDEGRRLAASWARLLPSGSELVIPVLDGDGARRFASLAGLRGHSPADAEAWCEGAAELPGDGASLEVAAVTDVRAWGR
jgi:hypothetical protein